MRPSDTTSEKMSGPPTKKTLKPKVPGLHVIRNVPRRGSSIFFHPDCNVGSGISPNQPRAEGLRVVGCTTGGDFHPALKIMFNCGLIIVPLACLCNP